MFWFSKCQMVSSLKLDRFDSLVTPLGTSKRIKSKINQMLSILYYYSMISLPFSTFYSIACIHLLVHYTHSHRGIITSSHKQTLKGSKVPNHYDVWHPQRPAKYSHSNRTCRPSILSGLLCLFSFVTSFKFGPRTLSIFIWSNLWVILY